MPAQVIIFDVIETLLDISALDPYFEKAFGRTGLHGSDIRKQWFGRMLEVAFVSSIIGNYSSYSKCQSAALDLLASEHNTTLTDGDRTSLRECISSLPPHADAEPALLQLKGVGLRLVALTNGSEDVAKKQLKHAGLDHLFEAILSSDSVQQPKPSPRPYQMAAEKLGVKMGDILLVAAHAWDTAGAQQAGCLTAFVAREGRAPYSTVEPPFIKGSDLTQVAQRILERKGSC